MDGGRDFQGQSNSEDRRRELRRPMASPADELSRGMARLDPYGSQDDDHVSGSGVPAILSGGVQARPAPSSDGWSSGENQFDVYHAEAGLHDLEAVQNAVMSSHLAPQLNVAASEFVPKSNLSASAAEFVPRSMARNTSQWGCFQNQPEYFLQTHSFPEGNVNPYHGTSSGAITDVPGDGSYNIEEYLSDAIATVVYRPKKLYRVVDTLTDKINKCVLDVKTLTKLTNAIVNSFIENKKFRPIAGRLTCLLAHKCEKLSFGRQTIHSLIIDRCLSLHSSHIQLLSADPAEGRAVFCYMAEILFFFHSYLFIPNESLSDTIFDILNTLFTVGYHDEENLNTAIQMILLCGEAMVSYEQFFNLCEDEVSKRPTPKMDQLMALVEKLANNEEKVSEPMRQKLKDLLEKKKNRTWGNDKYLPYDPFADELPSEPSSAITIEPDPEDGRRQQGIIGSSETVDTQGMAALTDEEMAFIASHTEANDDTPYAVSDEENNVFEDDLFMKAYEDFINKYQNARSDDED